MELNKQVNWILSLDIDEVSYKSLTPRAVSPAFSYLFIFARLYNNAQEQSTTLTIFNNFILKLTFYPV